MNKKKIVPVLFVVSALFTGALFFPVQDFFCVEESIKERECITSIINVIEPLLWSFLPLLVVSLILFFVRREVFIAWAKFAGVVFPLMLGILLYTFNNTPVTGSWIGGPTDDQLASVLLPSLFLIISLLIIIIKSWKLRGK
ncbi:MAG: hypothetical protein AAB523_00975 [Patescibacteria group bacterium]